MRLYLVRHAHAGSRRNWEGDDPLRPLSPKGRRQAERLAEDLEGEPIGRILSSPATRCLQTVQPLADACGLSIQRCPELFEEQPFSGVLRVFRSLLSSADGAGGATSDGAGGAPSGGSSARADVVVCSHGDILPELIRHWHDQGAAIEVRPTAKGSYWILETDLHGAVSSGRYVERADR